MPNMSLKKNVMPSQKPDVRNKNFNEVALGYTYEQAVNEAKRCLNCKNKPCVEGCPLNNNIPNFIKFIKRFGSKNKAFIGIISDTKTPTNAIGYIIDISGIINKLNKLENNETWEKLSTTIGSVAI